MNMQEEILDTFDNDMNLIGCMSRSEIHKQGLWHQTFHCWIVEKGENGGYILFQKRSAAKKNFPNTYDITAAGHLLAGESAIDGIREIEEELGIDVNIKRIRPVGVLRDEYVEANIIADREFCHVYFLENKLPLEKYNLQEEEVSGLVKAKIVDAIDFFSKRKQRLHVHGVEVEENGKLKPVEKDLGPNDFAPHKEEYVLSILNYAMNHIHEF